ncbi:hypothetical protein [Dermabacter hominis]|uniref:hypothetical protein n=1 Tax=Dermabacter hominis TaxID=36740 RepID=UPI002432DB0A|nr:hypothetical protein [Dermabacter hominis]
MSMRSTLRGASAAFAAALVLASCGATGGEVPTPTETPTHAPETAKPSPTQIPSAEESDKPSAEPSATPSESPSSEPSGKPSAESGGEVTSAPAMVAHITSDDDPEIGDFPVSKDVIAKAITDVVPDDASASVECDSDVDITAGKPKTHCTVKGENKTTETYVYGTFSSVQGTGLLVGFEKDFDPSLTAKFTETGTEVYAYGAGGMWAADAPADGANVSKKALKAMEAFEIPVSKFECTGEMFIPEGRNSQVCPFEAEWGKGEATVIAATILNAQESGVLVVLPTPADG